MSDDRISEALRQRAHYLNTLAFLKQHCPAHYEANRDVYARDLRAWDEWVARNALGRVEPGAVPP